MSGIIASWSNAPGHTKRVQATNDGSHNRRGFMLYLISVYSDYIGIVGVLLTLTAYYLLNVNKITSDSMLYLSFNLIGSCLLLVSLVFNWNLSSFLIEVAWVLISLIGLYRYFKVAKILRDDVIN